MPRRRHTDNTWYWTVQRLTQLSYALADISTEVPDVGTAIVGREGVVRRVTLPYSRFDEDAGHSLLKLGLAGLVFIGMLEPGKSGDRSTGFVRRLNLDTPITEDNVEAFRRDHAAKSRAAKTGR